MGAQFENRQKLCFDVRERAERCLKLALGVNQLSSCDYSVKLDTTGEETGFVIDRWYDGAIYIQDFLQDRFLNISPGNQATQGAGGRVADREIRTMAERLCYIYNRLEWLMDNDQTKVSVYSAET